MHILITGACGFVGSTLAKGLRESGHEVIGIDNLIRSGSQLNVGPLKELGCHFLHGDIRNAADLETLPKVDWVLDCAANASVLAGVDGKTSSRQLVDHNLSGTINLLEYCRRHQAGFILLSTSRVYSITPLAQLKLKVEVEKGRNRYTPDFADISPSPSTISLQGIAEQFSTTAPVSLYGATKLASEQLALEYGFTYEFPVWINRCGVMAGAGQFGHPAQGIFAFWIHSFREGKPLKYIGFDGQGRQVRDCLHPRDLLPLLKKQFTAGPPEPATSNQQQATPSVLNCAGGTANSMSLAELTAWCVKHFPDSPTAGSLSPDSLSNRLTESRPFDIPWMVLNPSLASKTWDWQPTTTVEQVCTEIAEFAQDNPDWLSISKG